MIKRIHSTLFIVKDISKTTEFYKTLGFDVKEDKDAIRIIFGDYRLAFMAEKDTTIKTDTENLKGVGMFLYFEVENVDDVVKIKFIEDFEALIKHVVGPTTKLKMLDRLRNKYK